MARNKVSEEKIPQAEFEIMASPIQLDLEDAHQAALDISIAIFEKTAAEGQDLEKCMKNVLGII